MDKQELLNKYLSSQLNSDETAAFNELKATDPEFSKEVSFHDDLAKVIQEEERQRLKTLLSKRKLEKEPKNNVVKIILLFIIAIVLITIFIYRFEKSQKSPEGIYASYFEPYPNTYRPVVRNSLNNAEIQGFTAYENGNYALAAEKFEESLKENKDYSVLFYLGICYGTIDNIPLAIQNLENAKKADLPYLEELHWYLGLFYLKQQRNNLAIENFQQFIELSKDQEKIQETKEILKTIVE